MTNIANVAELPDREHVRPSTDERIQVVVTGHVDHGKSTVIGRLLSDTGSLPDGKLQAVRATCERHAKPFEYAFLLDALKDEQAQGITIEAARVFFESSRRRYAIVDAPGHVEFLKNMISGAWRAEAALLVIDAREGVRENSRRHAFMLSMLGIDQVVVLINKMDLVDYSRAVFARIAEECRDLLMRVHVPPARMIPVSARTGENIAVRSVALDWYQGPTAIDALDALDHRAPPSSAAFRMPVQGVYKFTEQNDERRIIAGTVESGQAAVGDEVIFLPSGKKSRIKTIEAFNAPERTIARAGEATGFTLTEHVYLRRGEVAAIPGPQQPDVGTRLRVSLFWLGKTPLIAGHEYFLRLGTGRVRCRVARIHNVLDASTLVDIRRESHVDRHEVAECTIVLSRPLAFDTVARSAAMSRFVIVDGFEISGGGIVREALAEETGLRPIQPAVVWLTGLSGAGKSTIAREVCDRLSAAGVRFEYLDGDDIRQKFPNTGFSREERDAHIARVGFLASCLERHGVVVVCALISPYAASRAHVRGMCRRFIEVHVSTPFDECERRDVKGLYRRARRGEIANFTGVDDRYEPPQAPELRIDTTDVSLDDAASAVLAVLESSARYAAGRVAS